MSAELLGCPFCGETNLQVSSTLPNGQVWISCNSCELEGPTAPSEAEAITAFNTRKPDVNAELLAALQGWKKLHADMVAECGDLAELPNDLIEQFAATLAKLMAATDAAIAKAQTGGRSI